MKESLRLPLVLATICALAAGILTATYGVTSELIAARAAEALAAGLREVLPQAETFRDRSDDPVLAGFPAIGQVHEGIRGDAVVGTVFRVTAAGYGGPVEVLVGVDAAGTVTAVRVLSAAGETAGLGTRIMEREFLDQFAGTAEPPLEFRRDVQAITGATDSSAAVLAAANLGLEAHAALAGR
ncbi:MAG TPA: FMN-binding protein [Bacillota bacterium]|nr:FMN-binding protein [Bacillota bacterium]